MSRQSLSKAHKKITELSWEPTFATPATRFGTDYTFEKAPKKDPLKQVLRSYFPMQEEKDHRVYGASDGAIRGNMFRQVQERWLEWQKLFLSIIPLPEISAARAMPLLFRTVPNPELHNGQAIQMIDEVRHSTIQQNLKRLYMNNYIDPAGFNSSLRNFQNDYCGTIGRQFAEGFITGDAITAASIYLTIVAETAFTNTLFVAMPAEAHAHRIEELESNDGVPFRLLASPVRCPGEPPQASRPGPKLGADTDDVLRSLGYDEGRIEALRSRRVI